MPVAASTTEIQERELVVGGVRTLARITSGAGAPNVFVHGNPTHSADWIPFLEAVEGPSVAFDLIGFGAADRPAKDRPLDCGMHAQADFVEAALGELGIDRYRLVVHDWGALALIAAQRAPERVERLVVINAVPLLPGYRWHWLARLWRRRSIGEAINGSASRFGADQMLRLSRPGNKPMPPEFVEMVWSSWDAGMSRAMLDLYRSADPEALAAAGSRLSSLTCPALVLWGVEDPYIGVEMGRAYADVLQDVELEELADAGHWPWIDCPEVIDRIAAFLAR